MPKIYCAVRGPYHYAGGVIAEGESAELTDEDAARGIASGALTAVTIPSKATPKGGANSEETA